MQPEGRMKIETLARLVIMLGCVPVGWLADVKGVGWVTQVGGLLLACVALPAFAIVDAYPTDEVAVTMAVSVVLASVGTLCGSVLPLFIVELFPVEVRCVGAGFAYNVGIGLCGGLAPTISQASISIFHLAPGVLWMLGGLMTYGSVLVGLRWEQRGKLCMAHVRPQPYNGEATSEDAVSGKNKGKVCSHSVCDTA